MPTYRQGNMWTALPHVNHFLITTNAIVKRNGALVMGAGIAKAVRDSVQGIDRDCGNAIRHHIDETGYYGLLLGVNGKLGLFQVKRHYADAADIELIKRSTEELWEFASYFREQTIALNFPGIGNGKLPISTVKPLLALLPENVHIWTFN